MAAKNTHKINRSSITGRFVTNNYAKRNPKTTETENVRNTPKKRRR